MTERLLPLALACLALLTACHIPPWTCSGKTEPFIDDWRTVAEGPADTLTFLSIGDREILDNFANRGDVEVIFDPAATGVKIEMQRFTIASSQELADAAFERMQFWGYNASMPGKLDPMNPDDAALICFTGDNEACYARVYYNGQIQPKRDGANFRVTLPAGWDGDLEIVTSDNIYEGVGVYPDRSDVTVTGLAGTLLVDLDSGNVEVELDPAIDHYAGCASNDICETGNPDAMPPFGPFDPGCGCTEPSFVTIENGAGQASNITIDVPTNSAVNNEPRWYSIQLENEGDFSDGADFVCDATIDCGPFDAVKGDRPGCVIEPEFTEINYPGGTAIPSAGIQINATSNACSSVLYLEDPTACDLEEERGNLQVCSGCL